MCICPNITAQRQVATVSINLFAPALALPTSLLGCLCHDVGWLTVETLISGEHGWTWEFDQFLQLLPCFIAEQQQNLPVSNHRVWPGCLFPAAARNPMGHGWIHLWQVCILVPCSLYFSLALPYYWSAPWLHLVVFHVEVPGSTLLGSTVSTRKNQAVVLILLQTCHRDESLRSIKLNV